MNSTNKLRDDIVLNEKKIASFRRIEKNKDKKFNKREIQSAQNEIKTLTRCQKQLKTQLRTQLNHSKYYEFKKAELENKIKSLNQRIVSKDKKLADFDKAISKKQEKLSSLHNNNFTHLQPGKWKKFDGGLECKSKICDLNKARDKLSSSIEKNKFNIKVTKAHISHLDAKNKLTNCKSRLKQSKNNKQAKDSLKLEMKEIIKEMILSKSYLLLLLKLREAKDSLEKLEYDQSEKHKVSGREIDRLKNKIKFLEERIERLEKKMDVDNAAMDMIMEELVKWFAGKVVEEALGGNLREVVVAAAFLQGAKVRNLGANSEPEASGIATKIKQVAIGASEKLCMGQAVQQIATANPIMGTIFVSGFLAQHFVLGDGQLSTLKDKVASFVVAEVIQTLGNLALGAMFVGALGNGFVITAIIYLAVSLWYADKAIIKSHMDSIADIFAAGNDMVADATVNAIFDHLMLAADTKS